MAKTFQDLEREVAGLRQEIGKLKGDPNAANDEAVTELTDAAYEDPALRTGDSGMARLGNSVRSQQRSQNIARATSFARENSGLAANELVYQVATTYGLTVEDANRVVRAVRNE